MQSSLLIGNDIAAKEQYVKDFCKEKNISHFDVVRFAPLENSFGIEEIRDIQKAAYRSPQQGKEKLIILEAADKLTPQAQNALLKILEEPPANTTIFLLSTSDMVLLPTILSRCSVKAFTRRQEISQERKGTLENNLRIILTGSIGEKLSLAETFTKDKAETKQWIEEIIIILREKMLAEPTNTSYLVPLEEFIQAYEAMQTNVNQRLLLEHALLNIFNLL